MDSQRLGKAWKGECDSDNYNDRNGWISDVECVKTYTISDIILYFMTSLGMNLTKLNEKFSVLPCGYSESQQFSLFREQ